jgi:hypothetical protein
LGQLRLFIYLVHVSLHWVSIDKNVSAEDLQDYLDCVRKVDTECLMLKLKDGRVFKASTFRVSVKAVYRDILYYEATWPLGAELRDWYFRRPNGGR